MAQTANATPPGGRTYPGEPPERKSISVGEHGPLDALDLARDHAAQPIAFIGYPDAPSGGADEGTWRGPVLANVFGAGETSPSRLVVRLR